MPTVPQTNPKQASTRGTTVRALMLTTALVVAIIGGAALSGVATGSLQDVLRMTGIGRGGEIEAQTDEQQRQQSAVMAELERMVFTVSGEVAALNARIDETARPVATLREQFGKLDTDVSSIRGQIATMRIDQAKASTAWRGAPSDVESALKNARSDIDSLRSAIDGHDELERKVFDAIGKRISRLESLAPSDTTGSIHKRPVKLMKRHLARAPVLNTWEHQQNEPRW
ncbi:MAG: hypothetical protein ACLPKB_12240 [Xanthobacteraceae bacterium]